MIMQFPGFREQAGSLLVVEAALRIAAALVLLVLQYVSLGYGERGTLFNHSSKEDQ
jgi:hypothetical protein